MAMQITPEAISWAYRLLLDREPENRQVVQEWLTKSTDLQALVGAFLQSLEFKLKHPTLRFPSLTGLEPEMPIEMELSASDLQVLFRHIRDTWEYLGETEPHFSVFTSELFKQSKIKDNLASFYASGQHDVDCLVKMLARNGIDYSQFKSCLEFGCGVGRCTRWLCARFARVHGCDISQAHLRIAENYFAAVGIHNVTLQHIRQVQDLKTLPGVDLVYSLIVLQHNPPPIIDLIIRQFIRILNPGGIAFFQVPTYRSGYTFSLQNYLRNETRTRNMEMHALPQKQIFEIVRQEGGKIIEVVEDILTGAVPCREMSNTFIIQKAK
jgi:2-polyprenyl-3-methyl-5-hydroxy-6-metoxy-1,4-benzoquinol methylase